MPATPDERLRFRRKLGGDETTMPIAYIDDIFNEAEEQYASASYPRKVQQAAAYYLGALDLYTAATKLVDYRANESEVKHSQRVKALNDLVGRFKKELDEAVDDVENKLPAFRSGRVFVREVDRDEPYA
jgi:hypothetical protein